MTAKEELLELVEGLTDGEAREALSRLTPLGAERKLTPAGEQALRLAEFFDRWRGKGLMSEDEWEEFARDFDSHRPHRPLFT